ncbi:MAG: DUF975 family protein [Spirochaetes bacterium]|nr:DUF975 family protein [Spirochaetota bacterium]
MIDRASLKQSAKDKLRGKWGTGVLITFIYILISSVFSGLGQIKDAGPIFSLASLFVTAPLTLGLAITYIALVKADSLVFENLFSGFKTYEKSLGMYFWMLLWVVLWLLLFIVPGIIKAIAYSQAFFIIADNPDVRVRDAMKISIKMTDGHKGEIFVMALSFIGWMLLAGLTLFIGLLWLIPYIYTTFTNLYFKLKEMSLQSGACTEEMFNGTTRLVE